MKMTVGQLRILISESIDDARKALANLPLTSAGNEDFVKTPFSVMGDFKQELQFLGLTWKDVTKASRKNKLPLRNIELGKTYTLQSFVTRSGVERVLSGLRETEDGQDLPTVLVFPDDTKVIIDGNHRLVAELLKGSPQATVRIVDLSDLSKRLTSKRK